MSDNESTEDNSLRHEIDGFKVFIKARYCFPLNEKEQKIYDCYDEEEKHMINRVINVLAQGNELNDLIKEIIEEEEKKYNKNKVK
jgi:poly(A) polymerase Pap1